MTKTGRNDPCPCGSGRKYKHCCLKLDSVRTPGDTASNTSPVQTIGQPFMREVSSDAELYEFPDDEDPLDDLSEEELDDMLSASQIEMEYTFWQFQRLMASGLMPEGEEPDAVLNDWLDRDAVPEVPMTPQEQAQELMYRAWVTEDQDEQLSKAHEALEISPDCIDAHVFLGDLEAETRDEAREHYARAIEAGERVLGPEVLEDDPPDMTANMIAHPYFRASISYAESLMEIDARDEAVGYLERVLKMDKIDTQAARFPLFGEHLRQGDHTSAKRLMKRFRDDPSAAWTYGNALLIYQREGDSKQARRRLREAVDGNPYLGGCLTNLTLLVYAEPQPWVADYERKLDGFLGARSQVAAWAETPDALVWLMGYLQERLDDLPEDLRVILDPG